MTALYAHCNRSYFRGYVSLCFESDKGACATFSKIWSLTLLPQERHATSKILNMRFHDSFTTICVPRLQKIGDQSVFQFTQCIFLEFSNDFIMLQCHSTTAGDFSKPFYVNMHEALHKFLHDCSLHISNRFNIFQFKTISRWFLMYFKDDSSIKILRPRTCVGS